MADSIQNQIEQLRTSINALEAQRGVLGAAIVDPILAASRQQLALLEQQAAAAEGNHGLSGAPAEDRRMVTILFTDMVGSTSMAEKLDPEEWRRIVARTHSAIGDAITAHHGTIGQYLGDGLLAFFGARAASEADPENAIRAGLDAQSAVTALLSEDKVQLRVGIHTGLVVVGQLGAEAHKEFTASGDAMNLAARLQSAGPPGGVLISLDTYRYVRGVFDVTVRPPLTVKGKSEPIQTFLVRRAKPRPFRTVARGVAGIEIRTVGREAEMQALQNAYLRAFEEHGTVWAQLLGEPGMGKSRLLEDMDEWLELREETYRLLRARAFPDDLNQPYALVRRLWFDRFQIAEDAPLAQAEARWVERFKDLSGLEDHEEPAHALGLLVGLPFENSPHIKAMRSDPTQVKGRALVVSRELLHAVRAQFPVVLLLEDLQWADPASWEYLMEAFLGEVELQPNGLYILGAARPDWQPPRQLSELFKTSTLDVSGGANWGISVPLSPLTDQASRELSQEIFKRVPDVPGQVIDLLVERSEGVPYYTEEMVNWFIDHGILDTRLEQWHFFPEKLKEQPLPATLHHLLLTRLSSLSPSERSALQRGAIFGRRFWTGGLEALGVPGSDETLGHLQPRGFVEAQPESAFQGETEWSFHQNLLQEVTYESVLKRERTSLHKVAAEWLEKQAANAGRLDEFAGLLGDHYERAGELSAAADWYLQAARRAMGQGAPREAQAFYTQALELLPPVDKERRWQTLQGREAARTVLGDAGPNREDIDALLELAHSLNNDDRLAEAYYLQARFGLRIADVVLTDHASQEALKAARRAGNEAIEAKTLIITTQLDLNRDETSAAVMKAEEALRLARRLGDESVLAYVLYAAAICYVSLGDMARYVPLQREQIALDHRIGDRAQEATGLGNLASSLGDLGMYKQARAQLEQASQICRALGARRALAYDLGNLASIYRSTGDLRKARQLVEQALQEISPPRMPSGRPSC